MRRASKIDASQQDIVKKLRQCGVNVHSTAAVGGGFPDLVWAYRGRSGLLEVKTPKAGTKEPTRKAQEEFRAKWNGPVAVVTNWEEAMKAVLEAAGLKNLPCDH